MASTPDVRSNQLVWPELVVQDFQQALQWYDKVFGATVLREVKEETTEGKKRIAYSKLQFGNGTEFYVCEAESYCGLQKPRLSAEDGLNNPGSMYLQVSDADGLWAAMKEAGGAKVLMDLKVQYWGDKYGKFADPFGHIWSIGA